MTQLVATFEYLALDLRGRDPWTILRRIEPLYVYMPDLSKTVEISIADGTLKEAATDQRDGIIYS